jgi:hypothetical protein
VGQNRDFCILFCLFEELYCSLYIARGEILFRENFINTILYRVEASWEEFPIVYLDCPETWMALLPLLPFVFSLSLFGLFSFLKMWRGASPEVGLAFEDAWP